jgi:hypothetical protein
MTIFSHIKVVMGILIGLSITQLLSAVARLVQHPGRVRIYWVHLVWVLFMFLFLLHFWWWEYRLDKIDSWTFPLYLFIILYGVLLYLTCALLVPANLDDYDGYKSYFYSRHVWLFAFFIAIFVTDILDTFVKGSDYLHGLGPEYYVRTAFYVAGSAIAMKTRNERFHAIFAILATIYEAVYILTLFFTVR